MPTAERTEGGAEGGEQASQAGLAVEAFLPGLQTRGLDFLMLLFSHFQDHSSGICV